MSYLVFWSYWLLVWLPALAWTDPLVVQLPNGQLRGKDNGGYYSYEAIPYAEPPVSELRLEPPKSYDRQWSDVFDASQPPQNCLQWSILVDGADRLVGREDCLTVSVYKPKNESRNSFPVLAYIHGGAFMFGGPSENGHEYVMADGNMIMVKIAYRLGPLGFLSAGDAGLPGNLGLKDQRLALQWINKNIAGFGGDPEQVLLMGNSAGAASVHYQLLHGHLEGLVRVAFAQSGDALSAWARQHDEREKAFKLGKYVGCDVDGDSLALKNCLKSKDPKDIVSAVQNFLVFDYVPFAPFGPVVEAADTEEPFLCQDPVELMQSGKYAQLPFLISYTAEEGGFNAALFLAKQDNGKELIGILNARWNELAPDFLIYRHEMKSEEELNNYSQALKQEYLGNREFSADTYLDLQRMFSDLLFKKTTQKVLELSRSQRSSPLYSYLYDNPADTGLGHWLARRNDVPLGTVHCDDLYLILNNPVHGELRADEALISKKLFQMLLNFVESDKGQLAYGNCEFKDMAGQDKLELVHITSEACELLQLEQLP